LAFPVKAYYEKTPLGTGCAPNMVYDPGAFNIGYNSLFLVFNNYVGVHFPAFSQIAGGPSRNACVKVTFGSAGNRTCGVFGTYGTALGI
jgi:hypothetical protein